MAMTILTDPLFWGPIVILSLNKLAHMNAEQVFFSESLAMALILLLDAPSGILADKLGRKPCVGLGIGAFLVGIVIFATMTSPLHGYTANCLWAIGVSLTSGAKSALIYDELASRGEESRYELLVKQTMSVRFFIVAVATLATGPLAEINLRLPLYLSIPGVAVAFVVAIMLPENAKPQHQKHTLKLYLEHTKDSLSTLRANVPLMKLIMWFALLSVIGKMYFFTYNPYLDLVGVSYTTVGFIFTGINLVAFFASRYAFVVRKRLKSIGFCYVFIYYSAMMTLQGVLRSDWLSIAMIANGLVYGYIHTVKEPELNRMIASDKRATLLSFESTFVGMLQMAGFALVAPFSSNTFTFLTGLGMVALLLALASRK